MFIIDVVFYLTSGPFIADAFLGTIDYVDSVITGAILVFLYLTPIKDKFIKS